MILVALTIAKKGAFFAISIAEFCDRFRPAIFWTNGDRLSWSDREKKSPMTHSSYVLKTHVNFR